MNIAAPTVSPPTLANDKSHTAQTLGPDGRKRIALAVLAGGQPTRIAKESDVSRKFVFTWFKDDLLAPAGMTHADRLDVYDYLTDYLARLGEGRGKVTSLAKKLAGAKTEVLGFVEVIEKKLAEASAGMNVSLRLLTGMMAMLGMPPDDQRRYDQESRLRAELRARYHEVLAVVTKIIESTPRASSIAENVNSILRGFFFLRRQVGGGYLDLLQFYLNHRVLERSDRPERVGKTPREVLTGEPHAHWLELLGYKRHQYAA